MQTLSEIRAILAARGLRPRHRIGQHFLHDKNLMARLVEEAAVAPGEVVLEIGPGTGSLTEALVERGGVVIACEVDPDLASIVRERLGSRARVIEGDCLDGRRLNADVTAALAGRPFKLVANLPYEVASTLIGVLLVGGAPCRGMYVTVQKEVADRLLAGPGSRQYGALGVIVQGLADVALIARLAPSCFWPPPKVDSAMVRIVPRAGPVNDPAAFAAFVTRLFASRRKQLGTILGAETQWPDGVVPQMRPENLTVEHFVTLAKRIRPPRRGERGG